MQIALLMDTPKVVEIASRKLQASCDRVVRAETAKTDLETRLEEARKTLGTRRQALLAQERAYLLTCFDAFQAILQEHGQGYCPCCRSLVPFGGYSVMFTTSTVHHSEVSAREYRGGQDAYDEIVYDWYQVPHCCRSLRQPNKELESSARGHGGYVGRHFFYGTIADAPPELFTIYGIPAPDPEMIRQQKFSPWDLLPESIKNLAKRSA